MSDRRLKESDALGIGCAILFGLVLLVWGTSSAIHAAVGPYEIERCAEACGDARMASWRAGVCRCGETTDE